MRYGTDIRRLYAITVLRNFSGFYLPVIVPYYLFAANVDFAGFMLAESVFAAAVVLLEVPTGYLSDIWKRRVTMIVSGFFWMLATLGLLFAHTLFQLVLIQVLMAFAASFSSGTNQAMLYEYLAEDRREQEFRRIEGRRFAYGFYTLALTAPLAGPLYMLDERLPLLMATVAQVLMCILSFGLREPHRVKRGVDRHPLYDMLATFRYAIYGHREIAAIIALTAVVFTSTKFFLWSQQPYFEAAQIPVAWYGVLSAGAFLLIGISSQLAYRLERWLRPVALLGVILLVLVALATLTGNIIWYALAPLLLVGQAMYGVASPVVTDIISQRAEPERRATILSAQSLMTQLLFVVISLPYGQIAETHGIGDALLVIAATLLAIGGPAWLLLRAKVRA